MATLAGSTIASTYTYLLKMDGTSGLTSSLVAVQDGDATDSALKISTTSASVAHTVTTAASTPKALFIDANTSGVAAQDATGMHIDFDRTVAGSGTAAHNDIGIDLDVNSASLGTSSLVGMDIDVVGAASGTSTATGLAVTVGSADTNYAAVFSGGNVGIGTAAPGSMLDIKEADSNSVQETLRILDSDGTKQIVFNTTPGDGAYTQYFADDGSTVSTRIGGGYSTLNTYFNNGGNVGIGIAAPEGALNISSTLDADTDFSDGQYYHLHLHNPTDTNGLDCGIGFGISTTVDSVGASIVHERKGSDSYGDLVFGTKPSGGAVTERMRIASGGDVAISGDLIMADGKGIDFAAYTDGSVAGSTTSQTLKDYEEGTWDAVVTDGTRPMDMHSSADTGYYTKVGNLVTLTGYFLTTSLDGGSGNATGAIKITGLPFTNTNNNAAYSSGSAGYSEGFDITAGCTVGWYVPVNQSYMPLMVWEAATGTASMTAAKWQANGGIMVNLSYRAA